MKKQNKTTKKISWPKFKKVLLNEIKAGIIDEYETNMKFATDKDDKLYHLYTYKSNLQKLAKVTTANLKEFMNRHGFNTPENFLKALKFFALAATYELGSGNPRKFECSGNPLFMGCSWNFARLDRIKKACNE